MSHKLRAYGDEAGWDMGERGLDEEMEVFHVRYG